MNLAGRQHVLPPSRALVGPVDLEPGRPNLRASKRSQSNIDFDYRIIAKRKGYENVRLADQTDRVKQMKAHADQVAGAKKP